MLCYLFCLTCFYVTTSDMILSTNAACLGKPISNDAAQVASTESLYSQRPYNTSSSLELGRSISFQVRGTSTYLTISRMDQCHTMAPDITNFMVQAKRELTRLSQAGGGLDSSIRQWSGFDRYISFLAQQLQDAQRPLTYRILIDTLEGVSRRIYLLNYCESQVEIWSIDPLTGSHHSCATAELARTSLGNDNLAGATNLTLLRSSGDE